MSLFSALANEEQNPDQGWSNANMFSNSLPTDTTQEVIDINIWPTSKPGNVVIEQVEHFDPSINQYSSQVIETTPVPVELNAPGTVPVELNAPGTIPVELNAPGTVPVDLNAPGTVPVELNATGTVPVELNIPVTVPFELNTLAETVEVSTEPAVEQGPEPTVLVQSEPALEIRTESTVKINTPAVVPNSLVPVQSPVITSTPGPVTTVNLSSAEGPRQAFYSPSQNRIVIVTSSGGSQICNTPNANTVYRVDQKTDQSRSLLHDIVRLAGTPNSSIGAGRGLVPVETSSRGRARGRGVSAGRSRGRGGGRGRGRGRAIIDSTPQGTYKILAPTPPTPSQQSPRTANLLLQSRGGPTAGSFAGYTIPKIQKNAANSQTVTLLAPSSGNTAANSIVYSIQSPQRKDTHTVVIEPKNDHAYAVQKGAESAATPSAESSTGVSSGIITCTPSSATIVHKVDIKEKPVSEVNNTNSALRTALQLSSEKKIIRVEGLSSGSPVYKVTTSNKTPNKETLSLYSGLKSSPASISKIVKIPYRPDVKAFCPTTCVQQTGSASQTITKIVSLGQQTGMKVPTMVAPNVMPDVKPGGVVCVDEESQQSDSTVVNSDVSEASQASSQNSSISDSSGASNPTKFMTADVNNLKSGQSYIIDHGNGFQKTMIWDGTMFIEASTDPNHLSGGGSGDGNGEKVLKGNTTGLNMMVRRRPGRPSKNTDLILPNGRTFIHASNPSDKYLGNVVGRPPLHSMQKTSLGTSCNLDDENSQDSSQGEDVKTQDSGKRQNEDDGEYVVHCKFCGYSSGNTYSCERCFRKFPNDVKKEPVKRQKIDNGESESKSDQKSVVTKESFYGQKIQGQSQPYKNAVSSVKIVNPRGRRINTQGRSYNMVRITPSKKYVEPVTVIVSSDEEEDPTAQIANLSTTCGQVLSNSTSVSASQNHKAKNQTKSVINEDEDDELSKLVSIIPTGNSPTFKSSRINKMEDKAGNPIKKRNENTRPETPMSETPANVDASMSEASPLHSVSTGSLTLNARSVKVGTLKGTPIEPILISDVGIEVFMECEENSHKFSIAPSDMQQCLLHLRNTIPVIFIHTTVDFGIRLREKLDMIEDSPPENSTEPYFNPVDKDLKYQFIVLLLQSVSLQEEKNTLRVLESYEQSTDNKGRNFIEMLSYAESQDLLLSTSTSVKKSANPSVDGDATTMTTELSRADTTMTKSNNISFAIASTEMDTSVGASERSPSPRILFSGPIEKLITYPPPPTPGGIAVTNEDLFCLNEGEFLNDVIIDFYLKFLLLEVLSEDVRKRTHIFSSFFFKRLTQRQGRVADSAMSPAERRHATVKKWTKHVDLFDKDFIVIPINEHSHWFLAIICYPGLLMNESILYVPKHNVEKVFGDRSSTPVQPEMEGVSSSSTPTPGSDNAGEAMEEDGGNNEEKAMETETTPGTPVLITPLYTTSSTPATTTYTLQYTPSPSTNKSQPKELRGRLVNSYEDVEENKRGLVEKGQRVPCILIFDSLAGPNKARIVTILKEYLQVEWNMKKETLFNLKERVRGCTPRVPQQTNYSDCGLYVLQYVQSFFEDPLVDYAFPIKCLQNWFSEERMKKKRQEIKDLVMTIKEKNDAELRKKLQHLQQLKQQQLQQQQQQTETEVSAVEEGKQNNSEQS